MLADFAVQEWSEFAARYATDGIPFLDELVAHAASSGAADGHVLCPEAVGGTIALQLARRYRHVTCLATTEQERQVVTARLRDARVDNVSIQVGARRCMPFAAGIFDDTVWFLPVLPPADLAASLQEVVRTSGPGRGASLVLWSSISAAEGVVSDVPDEEEHEVTAAFEAAWREVGGGRVTTEVQRCRCIAPSKTAVVHALMEAAFPERTRRRHRMEAAWAMVEREPEPVPAPVTVLTTAWFLRLGNS